ncbi:hypothetical protein J4Q44_G00228010 [Coregonus suidteri]|uniref:Uncharacterized protein n=1 Tax=Coregonus suidteri TaxID=861788 RepID=A0AAN8QR43_9TELE
MAQDELNSPKAMAPTSDTRCPGKRKSCDRPYPEYYPDFTWSVVVAENPWDEGNKRMERKGGSPQGWEEGKNKGQ